MAPLRQDDMNVHATGLQAHIAFHLSGMRPETGLDRIDDLGLRPALLSGYRDLTSLRYDFPLVLIRDGAGEESVQSLSGLMDAALKAMPVGADVNRLSKHAWRLEREIRCLLAEHTEGSLQELWDAGVARLLDGGDDLLRDSLTRLREAVKVGGEVVDCNRAMPFRLCYHAWKTVYGQKARRFREDAGRLVVKLADILRADFVRSPEGLSAERLRASIGEPHQDLFDFDALSCLLTGKASRASLSGNRRRRIRWLLSVLEAQRFFPALTEGEESLEPYGFVFESCADAVAAYRERYAKMIEVTKAIAMASLEVEGEYSELRHDPFFANFGLDGLNPRDFDLFPDYLICAHASEMHAEDNETILEAFAAGLRAKVLVQTDDILEPSPIAGGNLPLGLRSRQLANAAISLSEFYVLQSPASNLFHFRDRIFRGFAYSGPALFSIYSGAGGSDLPAYLNAAAAMEARAFPAFTYDPSAGRDWASRFYLDANPQAERDWPVYPLGYEDEAHQRLSEPLAFTLIDLIGSDRRHARHFARVPRARWGASLAPVSEFLTPAQDTASGKVPYVLMVDAGGVLQQVIVDDRLLREARRCAEMWRSLQELGGIHSSHAARALAQERKAWAERAQHEAPVNAHAVPEMAASQAQVPAGESDAERPSDDPYIETPRCTSCNECTHINDKMFAYNENKQAYIANPGAGTYRQLVEAAESCQVSIIHPGQPRNPDEPDLDELRKRAEPFL